MYEPHGVNDQIHGSCTVRIVYRNTQSLTVMMVFRYITCTAVLSGQTWSPCLCGERSFRNWSVYEMVFGLLNLLCGCDVMCHHTLAPDWLKVPRLSRSRRTVSVAQFHQCCDRVRATQCQRQNKGVLQCSYVQQVGWKCPECWVSPSQCTVSVAQIHQCCDSVRATRCQKTK